MVDDIGLDLIDVLPPFNRRQAALIRAAFDSFESYATKQTKPEPFGSGFIYLVDDIGLEPMT